MATNELIHETSPYLLQHAENPVAWMPWSAAAFERAKQEDKPIFLSVGYSTCHWCHVMAHESFENEEVAELLKQHHSIQSDITYQADLLGQQINGKGSYSELRTKQIPYMRMELKIPLEDKMGVLVKVCNGRYLWTYRKVLEHEKLEQVDMDRVQEAKEKKAGVSPTNRPGDFDPSLTAVGVGGLPTIVRELNENFDFSTPTEAKLDQMPILRLEGTWNQANLLRLLPKQKKDIEQGQAPNLSELPPHIPDRVAVSLGAHDLFPYRIEYFRNNDRAGQGRGALMTVYFYNIRFDQKISEAYFDYRPGELEPVDKTHEYIEKLK